MSHRLAVRGLGTTQSLTEQLESRQQAETDADELRRWQQQQQPRLRAERLAQAQAAAEPMSRPEELGLLKLTVGGETYAWVQCAQPLHAVEDLFVNGHHIHLTPFGNEVILLPLPIASWLVANRPTEWRQMTVSMSTVSAGHDGASGLDTLDVINTGTFGYDNQTGAAWFTPDGDIGQNQSAYFYLDSSNQPWLVQ